MNPVGRKVLVITGVFPPARIAEGDHVLHVCRKLAERGLAVDVLTSAGYTQDAGPGVRVHSVMSKWDWSEVPRLARVARQCAPDVVLLWYVGHAYSLHPMITFAPTLFKRILPSATFVTQISGPVGSVASKHSLVTRALRKAIAAVLGAGVDYSYGTLFRDGDHLVVMANTHLQVFTRIAPQLATRNTLIPPPPFLLMSADDAATRSKARRALGVADSDIVFGYFGRLYKEKGLETLIEAFAALRAGRSGVKLAIIGGADANPHNDDWRLAALHEQAARLGIQHDIVWTGEYPWDSDLGSTYLRAVDIALLPYEHGIDLNHSSFAAVAAHGLPVITTLGAGATWPFIDGENVLLCPPRDAAATTAAMERLLVDVDLRQRLRSGIQGLAKHWFSWDVTIDRTIEAFNTPRRLGP